LKIKKHALAREVGPASSPGKSDYHNVPAIDKKLMVFPSITLQKLSLSFLPQWLHFLMTSNIANSLQNSGFEQKVDKFILSMNRAAEKAASHAKGIFIDSILGMTMDDAQGLLDKGNTAATDYLKSKTYNKIFEAYRPIISSNLSQPGGTSTYNDMIKTFTSSSSMTAPSLDLDDFVTNQAIEGLFHTLGREGENKNQNRS
jgi:hypothetical protein